MKAAVDIILPIYYEQDVIELLIQRIEKAVKTPHKIIAVWQDVEDPSRTILERISKKKKNLVVMNSEKGILSALKKAFTVSKSEIICIMMSDMSDDPKTIDEMVKKINEGYDLVCASRYHSRGRRVGGSTIKAFLSRAACLSILFLTKIPTHDATNAFKCFRRELLESIKIESRYGYEFPLEMTVKSYLLGKKISEVPTTWRERSKGKSKFKFFLFLPYYLKWYIYSFNSLTKYERKKNI